MTIGWILFLGFTFLCTVTITEGNYKIAWITKGDSHSGTHQWVTFQFIGKDGRKSKTFYPNEYFWRGRFGTSVEVGPSVGDIEKVLIGVQKFGWNLHHDDWNGYVVVITDLETKKVYQVWPGWIDTGVTKQYKPAVITCKDRTKHPEYHCRPMGNGCATTADDDSAFGMAGTDFYHCLKTCNYCVT